MSEPNQLTEKWTWMIDYCKRNRIPPAQPWAWKEAEAAYNKMKSGGD
jgi:hypothetical protein